MESLLNSSRPDQCNAGKICLKMAGIKSLSLVLGCLGLHHICLQEKCNSSDHHEEGQIVQRSDEQI